MYRNFYFRFLLESSSQARARDQATFKILVGSGRVTSQDTNTATQGKGFSLYCYSVQNCTLSIINLFLNVKVFILDILLRLNCKEVETSQGILNDL